MKLHHLRHLYSGSFNWKVINKSNWDPKNRCSSQEIILQGLEEGINDKVETEPCHMLLLIVTGTSKLDFACDIAIQSILGLLGMHAEG